MSKILAKERRNGSIRFSVFNHFVDHVARHIRPSDLRVWLYLWRRANLRNECEFSVREISKRTGLTWKSARESVAELERLRLAKMRHGSPRQKWRVRLEIDIDRWPKIREASQCGEENFLSESPPPLG